jgi:hypothetical protein
MAQNSERAVLTRTSMACEFEPRENDMVDQLPSLPVLSCVLTSIATKRAEQRTNRQRATKQVQDRGLVRVARERGAIQGRLTASRVWQRDVRKPVVFYLHQKGHRRSKANIK